MGRFFASPADLPNPGIELESPALQADSLPTELSGEPLKDKGYLNNFFLNMLCVFQKEFVHFFSVLESIGINFL